MPKGGDIVGEKYKLLSLLGEGGMSEVFAAENLWMARRVAIKTLLPGLTRSERIVQRFWQEARIASQIEHPNIARVLDIGIDEAQQIPYIVQELLEGESLRDHLRERPGGVVPPDEALALMGPILRALVAVHRQNILHRDLKPGNLFLVHGRGGTLVPKLIDFGISKILAEADEGGVNTRTGTPLGTPLYMSPEQASGRKDIDAQVDVWSMGVVLYEMLAGRCPYEGDNHNVIIAKILRDAPARLEGVAPDVPRALTALVHRAIEPDRGRRFRTAQEFLDALEAYEAGEYDDDEETRVQTEAALSSGAPGLGAPTAGAPSATPVQWSDQLHASAARSPLRDRKALLAALAALVMVSFSVAFVLGRSAYRGPEVHPTAAALPRLSPPAVVAPVLAPPPLAAPPPPERPPATASTPPGAVALRAVRTPRPVRPAAHPARQAPAARRGARDPLAPELTFNPRAR